MANDWRISTEERTRYESFFQKCGPVQGYLSGEQARDFFVKSNLPADILRKIWDLADITVDGRLDVREFVIACHLIAAQVQRKGPLPSTLPSSLLSDLGITASNILPTSTNTSSQPLTSSQNAGSFVKPNIPNNTSQVTPLTPVIRSKYLQQFQSLVDPIKTNGLMTGLQAKTILVQTGLPHTSLHQIWDLSDIDKDGCLTANEYIIAMHCCDIARSGQTLPTSVPGEWLCQEAMQRESSDPSLKTLPQQIKEPVNSINTTISSSANQSNNEIAEAEHKSAIATYEERRLKNYEDGNRELERRRQLLREQEEREQKEREERDSSSFESRLERKRELEMQKQKEEQERKKQMELERQLEKQRQIEQQKEEERRKLYEQREAARKEMERKSRLEWERQRMLELSTQKSRLLEQINDLKSREKAFELELESMGDTMQTCQTKITQIETNIHHMDESIADIQRNIMTEKNLFDDAEQKMKELRIQCHTSQAERESLDLSLDQLNQSLEFGMGNRGPEHIKHLQTQIDTMKQENQQVDEEIQNITDQYKECQTELEQLRLQFNQLEQDAKAKETSNEIISETSAPIEFANFDQFNTDMTKNDVNDQTSDLPSLPAVVPTATSPSPPPPSVDVDPFQTVDPFASHSDIGSTTTHNDWFPPTKDESIITNVDPFASKIEPTISPPTVASPRIKKAAPKANPANKIACNTPPNVDPWGTSTSSNHAAGSWAQFNQNTNSPFGTKTDWTTATNGNTMNGIIQYRILYDYAPERTDEMALSTGDIVTVDPTKQPDEHWLFGQLADGTQGFFPAIYAEPIVSTTSNNTVDTTSQLVPGSWVITLAEYQDKTADKHLSFGKDEFILVREQQDATLYSGELCGKIGWFPRAYVRPATETEVQNYKNLVKSTSTNVKSSNSNGQISKSIDNVDDVYEAIYSYEATDPSDLSFEIGDRILVLKRDGDWWTGQIDDRVGLFPYNYVEKVNATQEIAIAITAFNGTDEDHLSFEPDQVINIIKKDNKGWCQGEIRIPDQPVRIGWFPINSVKIQEQNSSCTPSVQQNSSTLPQYIALFPYDAQQDDELSFPADAVLEILEEANATGWFKARLDDRVGLVPSTYIQPITTHNQSSSISHQLASDINLCSSKTMNPCQVSFSDNDSAISSARNSSILITDVSLDMASNNASRIAAIRELIETEQRYVNDLRFVMNELIVPLSNDHLLNEREIEQIFSNWFNLIACNSILLTTLQVQVQYSEHAPTSDHIKSVQIHRSSSMPNIEDAAQSLNNQIVENNPLSTVPQIDNSITTDDSGDCSLSNENKLEELSIIHTEKNSTDKIMSQSCNQLPSSSSSSSSMIIDESTLIGEILCSYLPYMADTYFQYCNCRSQADKHLQSKMDSDEQFVSKHEAFQIKASGLSLNSFLTKPIQRVTRYPLLIEKILKYTMTNHPDYQYVQHAFQCARQLNERINQQIREQENTSRLEWLQQHCVLHTTDQIINEYFSEEIFKFNSVTKFHKQRQLLLHGFINKAISGKELIVFLFNDFLLMTTINTKTLSSNPQQELFDPKSNLQLKLYRHPLLFTNIIAVDESPNDQLVFIITTKIYQNPLLLKVQQSNLRTLWLKSINDTREKYQAMENVDLAQNTSSTIAEGISEITTLRRLILVVLEATDLSISTKTSHSKQLPKTYCQVTIGSKTLRTPVAKYTDTPKWNTTMEFYLTDITDNIMHLNIYKSHNFTPDEIIDFTTIPLTNFLECTSDEPLEQPNNIQFHTLPLNGGSTVKLTYDLKLPNSDKT